MVKSTCILHTSSHPDKYNNSANRIISDPRTDTSIFFEYSVSTQNPSILQELQCFHMQSSNTKFPQLILHTELILPQEILQLQGSSRADQYKASSSKCPRASKHSTWQNKAPGSPTALQAHTAQAGFHLILPNRNSILSGSQHPQRPYKIPQAHSYRILPGEIGFISKGSSIVYLCNTKVSVFQFTY